MADEKGGAPAGTPLPPGYEPPGGYTPMAPPASALSQPLTFHAQTPSRGNLGFGFLLGLFGGCVGLGLVYVLAKGPDTRRGALIGFGVFSALLVVSQVLRALLH